MEASAQPIDRAGQGFGADALRGSPAAADSAADPAAPAAGAGDPADPAANGFFSQQSVSTSGNVFSRFISRLAAMFSMGPILEPYPAPDPTEVTAALNNASVLFVRLKKARGKAIDQASTDYAEAYAAASQLTGSYWLGETEPAYVAVGLDGLPYMSPPSHWPAVLWPDAGEIWARVDGLYSITTRYVDPEARIFPTYELARIQGELLTLTDLASTLEPAAAAASLSRVRARLDDACANLQLAATTRATTRYLHGMVRGLLVTVPVTIAIGFVVGRILPWNDLVVGATACAIAGQFGALVSVLTRVSAGGLNVDYRAGDRMLRTVGFARPVLGAILASAVYFATVGGVVPLKGPDDIVARFAFFMAIGFIAGFSERYAQDMLAINPSDQQKAQASAARAQAT